MTSVANVEEIKRLRFSQTLRSVTVWDYLMDFESKETLRPAT
jgi:hypothetical protein